MDAPSTYASPTLGIEALKHSITYKLMFTIGKGPVITNKHEWLDTTLFATRGHLVERWLRSNHVQLSQETCQVYYLSMEFLINRILSNALLSLSIYNGVKNALEGVGLDLEDLIDEENGPGLDNNGLGRLVACFLDPLATLGLPGRGYGIRCGHGMFKWDIVDGRQKGSPGYRLGYGNSRGFRRHSTRYKVRFGGHTQQEGEKTHWIGTEETLAVACDQIIPGYDIDATNMLRLWNVQASSKINLGKFNQSDYSATVGDKSHSEGVSRVFYPDDSTYSGRELRLCQKYFLVPSTVQNILNRYYRLHKTYGSLTNKIAIHLSDTHLVLSIPKLMHLLIGEHKFSRDDAPEVCCQVFSYTNHTLVSEAPETWPVDVLNRILSYRLQIIFEINDYLLRTLQKQYLNDISLLSRTSVIDEPNGRRIHMTWLTVVVGHKVNDVSELRSDLMMQLLLVDFAKIFPTRFYNVTNDVTPRHQLALANPSPSGVLNENIDRAWHTNLSQFSEFEQHCDHPLINQAIHYAKLESKKRLPALTTWQLSAVTNPKSLFDVQIERIHEYKCQSMNVPRVITRHNRIKADLGAERVPHMNIFAGGAASAYCIAKYIIHLINSIAKMIDNDPQISGKLKTVFVPDYSVSLAQMIIPATDFPEQTSLAGAETPGISNMKFVLNGTLTIGTPDGANVEMLKHVGAENTFIFGNTVEEVKALHDRDYKPREYYERDEELHQMLTQVGSDTFSPEEPKCCHDLVDSLINFGDHYQVLAGYRSYIDCQSKVDELYRHSGEWTTKSMINIANIGYFSPDRTVKEHTEDIWHIDSTRL